MRGLRSTVLLVAILGALVGYIYFVDAKKPASGTETKAKAFAGVSADEVDEVEITLAGSDRSRAQKSGGKWKLAEPVQADADEGELTAITGGLAGLDVERVLDENPADVKPYGLNPARIDVGFRVKGQKELRHLLLGEKTPTGGDLYAQVPGQKRVFLVNASLDATFNKNTFALRDKSVLKFDRDKVDAIELASGAMTVRLAKSDDRWKILEPIQARGDYGAIEAIIGRLATVQMQGIVAPEAGDLKQYGLDKPTATLTVAAGSARATLALGRTDNALVFAKDSSRPMIFTVAPTLQSDTIKDPGDYRLKDLFDARSFTTEHIEFKRGAETLTFAKTKGKDGKDAWRNGAGKDVDAGKMEDLLAKVTALQAQSFEAAANPALKAPVLTVNASYGDKKMEAVTFGRNGNDTFAARAGEPGTAKLEAAAFDEVMKALDGVK